MSGHNKWSKIKHKKAASDAEKSKVFSKHSTLITMESRRVAGDVNSPNLAAAILRAKQDSMPKENIDRAVAKGSGAGSVALTEVMFEAFGPGGVALLITAVTDNNNRTSQEVKTVFTKAGLQLGSPGSATWAFTKTNHGYTPILPVDLSENDEEKLALLIDALNQHDDVHDIYTTAAENDTADSPTPE